MKFRFFNRAKGGRLPKPAKNSNQMFALSPGGVLCGEKGCDWGYVSWSVEEQLTELREHKKDEHRT